MTGDIYDYADENRLRADIEKTAEFGQLTGVEGIGRTVLAGFAADKQDRQ